MAEIFCSACSYDDLWIEWEKGQRVFYDQRDDLVDPEGLFAGYGPRPATRGMP